MASTWGTSWGASWGTSWDLALVVVPDVVGQTQAEATAVLKLAGFVVAVVTATSDSVASGSVISQEPAAGAYGSPGSTVTITVSSGADDILSAKYQGYPNVRRRGLQPVETPPVEPLPADITNMPDAPPAPKPEMLARGVAADLAAVTPEAVPDVPVPHVPVPKVRAAPKLALVAPVASGAPATSAPAADVPAAPAPVAPTPQPPEDRMPALVTRVNALIAKVDVQDQQIAAMEKATAALVKALESKVNALSGTLARERMNRLRAEEITRKLLKDLVEED